MIVLEDVAAWSTIGGHQVTVGDRSVTIPFLSRKGVYAMPLPRLVLDAKSPKAPTSYYPPSANVSRSMRALLAQDALAARTAADTGLSDVGKSRALHAPRIALMRAVAKELREAQEFALEQANRLANHFTPPALGAGDMVGAILDGEARAHWRTLSEMDRARILASGEGTPDADRMITALRRSPVPLQLNENLAPAFERAWSAVVERRDPGLTKQLRDVTADAQWSLAAVTEIKRHALDLLGGDGERRAVWEETIKTTPDVATTLGVMHA